MKRSNHFLGKSWLFAISFVFTCICHNMTSFAQLPTVTQSNCFTVTLDTTSQHCGGNGDCIDNCPSNCIKVKICSDRCPGLNPTSFTITSNYDQTADCRCYPATFGCHNDPNDRGAACSWQGPRIIDVSASGGLADGACINFFMCEGYTGNSYSITCNTSCGSGCTAATFNW